MVLLNKKRDKKTNKKKKSEILDKYKNEIKKDLDLENKPTFNLLNEKKIINKEKSLSNSDKFNRTSKVYEKYKIILNIFCIKLFYFLNLNIIEMISY